MANCRDIEPTLTAYVDGECAEPARSLVEAHIQVCPRCRRRLATERATHELVRERRLDLRSCASPELRQRCAGQRAIAKIQTGLRRRPTWVPVSLAATLVLATSVLLLFGWGSSVETYAAQLVVDHLKCFQFPPDAGAVDAAALGRTWQTANGWPLRIAPSAAAERLELLGVRRCGSTRGRVAHVFYRWRGEPVSVYVLNGTVDNASGSSHHADAHDTVTRLGKQAIIWSDKGRTYAIVARQRIPDLEQVAGYVRRAIE